MEQLGKIIEVTHAHDMFDKFASVGAGSFQPALGDMQELYLQAAYVGHTP